MADDLGSVSEHYVTDPYSSCLFSSISDKGVFTAAHGEEEGTAYESSPGLLSRGDGHLESVLEDYW